MSHRLTPVPGNLTRCNQLHSKEIGLDKSNTIPMVSGLPDSCAIRLAASVSLTSGKKATTSETWQGNTVGPYDYVRLDWVSGSKLEVPGFQSLTNGWSAGAVGNTDVFSFATGPSVNFNFHMAFQGMPAAGGTVVEYFVYNGTTLKQAQRIGFNGSGGFSFAQDLSAAAAPGRHNAIPEPTTLALLLVLGAAGMARWRIPRA